MDVVIVESPAKAKTINKYLGDGFKVLASYGHIRDLPSKDGSVRPDDDFAMDWEIDPKSSKHLKEITTALKGAERLYLATDPDREGEAISWHMQEVLEQKKLLKGIDIKRVVFNEITKSAILEAFEHPRDLDLELVDAYLARRALDYLVGFNLSPVLWRKLPGSRSAGRVQSVALRLICDRETEFELFRPQEYWTVTADFNNAAGKKFTANLTHLDGDKLGKMSLTDEAKATAAVTAIEAADFSIAKVERKQSRRNPAAPFTTSTLQQEAARKLYFGAKRTMQVAQRLYEGINLGGETVGLITYMRTDGVTIASSAIDECRKVIGQQYGDNYVPKSPRVYKTKAKNAQEAHEAVRPTDVSRLPKDIASYLDDDQRKLYDLIWKRTVASQMEAAVLDQVGADITASSTILRATGSVIAFDGFYKLYREGIDDSDERDGERILPDLKEGEKVERLKVDPEQHFTQPPPRFSEASLVKRLEELGIGRPSTYASIISVLQDRNYVIIDKRRFIPEDRGRLVTAFLSSFFPRYVEFNFTAELENQLDEISDGRVKWKSVLKDFWKLFSASVDETKELRVRDVLNALDDLLGPHFFPEVEGGRDTRLCPTCNEGRLNLKLGKFGAFIGCANYPECRFTRPLVVDNGENGDATNGGPILLGKHPENNLEVTLRKGPYGHYVQLGEEEVIDKKKKKPKRSSLAKTMDPATIDLEKALALLSLPRDVGLHPESGKMIAAAIGPFGPYLRHDSLFYSLKGDDDVLAVGLNRAVTIIADAPKKEPPKTLGEHPKDKKPVTQRKGRWGPFVQHGKIRANIPKDVDADTIALEEALKLIAAKSKGGKKAPAKKATAKKADAKKKPAKKKTASKAKKKTAKSTETPET